MIWFFFLNIILGFKTGHQNGTTFDAYDKRPTSQSLYERSNKLITHRIKELNDQTINHEKLEHGPINTTLTALVDDAINARDMHDSIMIDRDVIEIDRMENLD